MAKIVFTEGQLPKKLADTGWMTTVKIALSVKPCSGAGTHTAGETIGLGDWGEISGAGWYTPGGQSATEPSAAADGSKTWPTVQWNTLTFTNGPNSVKSAVLIDPSDNKLLIALDLTAIRDLSQANTIFNYTLSTSNIIS